MVRAVTSCISYGVVVALLVAGLLFGPAPQDPHMQQADRPDVAHHTFAMAE